MPRPDFHQGGRWIGSALARLGQAMPGPAGRATATLRCVLAPLRRSPWPELAWSFSHLGPKGSPVELVWRPGVSAIGWTSEVSGPSTRETRRLALAVRRLKHLNAPLPPQAYRIGINRTQSRIALEWGAWLGAKHGPGEGDSFKLYAEIGRESLGTVSSVLGDGVLLCDGRDLRLFGLSADGSTEVYGRFGDGDTGWLAALAAQAGLQDAFLEMIGKAETLMQRAALRRELEDIEAGWSLAFAPDGRLVAIAMFFKPGFYAANRKRLDHVLESLSTGSSSDAAWTALLGDGLCQPSILGLVASLHGVTSQMAMVGGKASLGQSA